MNILITICARGGSKGIPGKNIKPLAGKPLIGYTIEQAQKISKKLNAKLTISTNDKLIKKIAEDFGLKSNYNRPDFLSNDTAGKIDAIKDILFYEESLLGNKFDLVLDLDVTSPLRKISDIMKALEMMNKTKDAISLFSVNKSVRNPYFNMVEKNSSGFYSLVKKKSKGDILSRQAAPKVYDLNASFYFFRRNFFELGYKSSITEKSLIYEMDHICFDLDHTLDFLFMEYLLLNDKLDFEL